MKIIDYLQSISHSIDMLLALDSLSPNGAVGWNDVKQWCRKQGIKISDSAFRKRRDELIDLGLAVRVPMDNLKSKAQLTKKGKQVAFMVRGLAEELNEYPKK